MKEYIIDKSKTNLIIENLLFCVELEEEAGLTHSTPDEIEEMKNFLLSLKEKFNAEEFYLLYDVYKATYHLC